jgi:hypothetical protein
MITDAYNMTTMIEVSLNATESAFKVKGVTCSEGFIGIPVVSSCATVRAHAPGPYVLSGCSPAPESNPAARVAAMAVQMSLKLEQYLEMGGTAQRHGA